MSKINAGWTLAAAGFFALSCAAVAPAAAQERKFAPVDEAANDASWTAFRKRLLDAVEKRDLKFVLSILDRNVRASIDGERGTAGFRKAWDVDAADTPLWRELRAALVLGSAWLSSKQKGSRELCAPYLLARWPSDVDPLDYGAIVATDVLVKAGPHADSNTMQTLSYDIVLVSDWEIADRNQGDKQRWVKIRVKSGEGYVPEEQIRSPIEQTACFAKTDGRWRMTAFAPAGGPMKQ